MFSIISHNKLHKSLSIYECGKYFNVSTFLHYPFRMGLIRARLAGARLAKGDVLVFLDAHCEGVVGWLEPLLQRIQESRTSVLMPIIDRIDAKDFHYIVNGYKNFRVFFTNTK